ncbi:hypothetical protein DSECCO2_629490 [anaerobic digester metagenome]
MSRMLQKNRPFGFNFQMFGFFRDLPYCDHNILSESTKQIFILRDYSCSSIRELMLQDTP